ncbi:hypothetical protein F4809DRAFT_643723 [Biscogniauxia mediterranea]|nr:hypothetical protein F4809DRAFT_643723 [Biscogniauxia mediterranea]
MSARKLAEISRTLLHDLDATIYEIEVLSAALRPLLPASKFWRWQIQALVPLALQATRRQARRIRRAARETETATASGDHEEEEEEAEKELARACLAALEFLARARETTEACGRVVAKWNRAPPWDAACCEALHEALCGFPGIAVPEDVRRYAPVRRAAAARRPESSSSWFGGYL